MKKRILMPVALAGMLVMVTGCDSSSNSTNDPDPPLTDIASMQPDSELQLDFTLPLASSISSQADLTGATFNSDRGEFVFVGAEGGLVYLSPEGAVSGEAEIDLESAETITGIEYLGGGSYYLSTSDSRVVRLQDATLSSETLVQLDFEILAVGYDEMSGSAIVIDTQPTSRIVTVSSDGSVSEALLDASFASTRVTGLTVDEGTVYIAALAEGNTGSQTLIVAASLSGEIGPIWSLDTGYTSGLVLLDSEAPEFLTSNSDANQSVTLFEAEREPSRATEDMLDLISAPELEFDQPSGIDYDPSTGDLYYVTDFGEVRKGTIEGDNNLLFEIESMQGSFEAISFDAATQTITLMVSDESTEGSQIMTFDLLGNILSSFPVPIVDQDHLFESLDYSADLSTYYAMTAGEGSKVLYRIAEGVVQTSVLPSAYDNFVVSGIAVSDDGSDLFFVTEEWEAEDGAQGLNAGLLIELDLEGFTELARNSIAVEVEGQGQGIRDPSDIAVDETSGLIFITSDVDDSQLYVFADE